MTLLELEKHKKDLIDNKESLSKTLQNMQETVPKTTPLA